MNKKYKDVKLKSGVHSINNKLQAYKGKVRSGSINRQTQVNVIDSIQKELKSILYLINKK